MAVIAPIVSTFDNRGIKKASDGFSKFSREVGDKLKKLATVAAGIGAALAVGSYKAIQSASDLAEAVSATEVIFGDAADAVIDFANKAADAFGQSKQQALDGAQALGTFGKAAGLSGDDLAEFTTGLLGLSSDIASFRNAKPEEVIEAIGAGLRGESEPLRRFGVLLDDATLKAEALALGIYNGNGTLTQQQKILAAESAIWKQTGDAQGDFARTSDGLANQQRILSARFANIIAQIGQKLLPIALKLSDFFLNRLLPVVQRVVDIFSIGGLSGAIGLLWYWVKTYAPKIGQKLLDMAKAFVGWIQANAGDAIKKLGEWLTAIGKWIVDTAYPYLKEKVPVWADALWGWVQTDGFDAIKKLGSWLLAIGEWIIFTAVPAIAKKTAEWAVALYNWVDPYARAAISKLGEWLGALGGWITSTAWPTIKTKTAEWASALWEWINTDARDAIKAASQWINNFGDWIRNDAAEVIRTKTSELTEAFFDWIDSKFFQKTANDKAGDAAETFGDALVKQFAPALIKLNVSIVKAILDGLTGAVEGAAKSLARSFVNSFTTGEGGIVNALKRALSGESTFNLLGKLVPGTLNFGGARAAGGPVSGGVPYIVGEQGPELFVPGSSGSIIPNGRMGGTTVNVVVNGALDPVSVATQIERLLVRNGIRLGAA